MSNSDKNLEILKELEKIFKDPSNNDKNFFEILFIANALQYVKDKNFSIKFLKDPSGEDSETTLNRIKKRITKILKR
jgi:hypothetical protein